MFEYYAGLEFTERWARSVVGVLVALWCVVVGGAAYTVGVRDAAAQWTQFATAPTAHRFDANHAQACRVVHMIATNAKDRALAVLACEHAHPEQWVGELNYTVAWTLLQEERDSLRRLRTTLLLQRQRRR